MTEDKKKLVDKIVFGTALLIGAIAVCWIGLVFIHTNVLALAITIIIGSIYSIGVVELLRFRRATETLATALSAVQEEVTVLDEWLAHLDPSIRNAVRARVRGRHVGLPAPVLTPYFVGLLVMLGLLGTFVGMVDTLKGTVIALEKTTELQAIRDGLTAPIKGLGLAFGTSVAGVATSAMLGLMSTLSKRERMLETRQLDTKIPAVFREFSMVHSQEETFKALQVQTRALPAVAEKLDAIVGRIETLNDALVNNQKAFFQSVQLNFSELAASLDATYKHGITENVRLTGEMIKPVAKDVLEGIARDAKDIHGLMTRTAKEHLTESYRVFEEKSEAVAELWKNGVAAHNHANDVLIDHIKDQVERLQQSSDDLILSHMKTEETWLDEHGKQMAELTQTLNTELGRLRDDEERRGQAAVDRLSDLESALATHMTTLGKGLEEPLTRLIRKVSEVPRTAADVVEQLRQEVSKSIERDNVLLNDRQQIMEELNHLSTALVQSSGRQSEAIDQLISAADQMLKDVGQRFSEQVGTEVSHISEVGEMFAAGAAEMAGLGDAFNAAVQMFSRSNDHLIENLSGIEAALETSTARSDDQLAYYVAQAREIIDQCLLSQKEIFETLQQFYPQNDRELEAC